jgi:hypothetical protein
MKEHFKKQNSSRALNVPRAIVHWKPVLRHELWHPLVDPFGRISLHPQTWNGFAVICNMWPRSKPFTRQRHLFVCPQENSETIAWCFGKQLCLRNVGGISGYRQKTPERPCHSLSCWHEILLWKVGLQSNIPKTSRPRTCLIWTRSSVLNPIRWELNGSVWMNLSIRRWEAKKKMNRGGQSGRWEVKGNLGRNKEGWNYARQTRDL